jgi:hypothetical protein
MVLSSESIFMPQDFETIRDFLGVVANNADPNYTALLKGIADHFNIYGRLSSAQFNPVKIAALKQGRDVPDALYHYLVERPHPTAPSGASDGASSDRILADLCEDIADALVRAATRLAPTRS